MSAPWKVPENYRTRPIAVLGGGVLGRRIATCWVSGGYNVQVREPDAAQRAACVEYVKQHAATYPAAKSAQRPVGEISAHADLAEAVKDAWLVVEAVPEDLQLKIDTFAELEALAPKDAILASNSSSYKSSEMLDKVSTKHAKARILNTHYYMPPHMMVVELMTDGLTDPTIIDFMAERQREAGTTPFVARKQSTGFIFNRLWAAIKRETLTILAEGVSTPQEIDELFGLMFGTPVGPCRMMDQVGLDTVALIEGHYAAERGLSTAQTVDYLRANYLDDGRLGAKTPARGGLHPRVPRLLVLDLGLGLGPHSSRTSGSLRLISADGSSDAEVIGGQAFPDGIDVDAGEGRMFWTNMDYPGKPSGFICSARPDGSDVKVIVPAGVVNTPKQLVVEPRSRKLYFCDREGMRVMRCDYDGGGLETLVKNGDWQKDGFADQTKWCVGIAVAPKYGKFYWTQKGPSKGGEGRLFCANIEMPEGTTAETRTDVQLLKDRLPEPIDLEVDEKNDLLYWTDRGELPFGNTVNRAQLDSSSGVIVWDLKRGRGSEIIVSHLNEAIGIKLDHETGHMYLTDLGGSIYRCNMDGSQKTRIYSSDQRALTGITLL